MTRFIQLVDGDYLNIDLIRYLRVCKVDETWYIKAFFNTFDEDGLREYDIVENNIKSEGAAYRYIDDLMDGDI